MNHTRLNPQKPVSKLAGQKLKPVSWSIGGTPTPPAWSDGLDDVRLTYQDALELWRTDMPYLSRDGVSKIKEQEREAERDSKRAIDQANRYDQTRQEGAGHADPLTEGAQFLREASKLHFQASAELEEAWMKLEAALGHEDELRVAYKRMRSTPRSIEKVFGRSPKSYDNPDFLLAAKAYRRVLDWFLTLDKEHLAAKGAADKLTKQARELEGKAAVLFAVSQGRLRAFDTYREAADRFGPRAPMGVGKLSYRVKSSTAGLVVTVYDGTKRVGGMSALKRTVQPRMACINDILDLIEQYPELEDSSKPRWVLTSGFEVPNVHILSVNRSVIDESLRGRGAGTGMYIATMRAWFDEVGPFLFIPDGCDTVGSTSPEAKRVWLSLATKFPSNGLVIAVLRRP